MNNLRKEKIFYFYKKAYDNQSVMVKGSSCDLSLLWNAVEYRTTRYASVDNLLDNISYQDLKILARKNKGPIYIDHPLLVCGNQIIDGHEVLLKNISKKQIEVIDITDKDIKFSKMD